MVWMILSLLAWLMAIWIFLVIVYGLVVFICNVAVQFTRECIELYQWLRTVSVSEAFAWWKSEVYKNVFGTRK